MSQEDSQSANVIDSDVPASQYESQALENTEDLVDHAFDMTEGTQTQPSQSARTQTLRDTEDVIDDAFDMDENEQEGDKSEEEDEPQLLLTGDGDKEDLENDEDDDNNVASVDNTMELEPYEPKVSVYFILFFI